MTTIHDGPPPSSVPLPPRHAPLRARLRRASPLALTAASACAPSRADLAARYRPANPWPSAGSRPSRRCTRFVWTEYMKTPDHVEYMALPRMAALAEVVWSPADARDPENLLLRLEAHLRRLEELGVRYRPPREAAPAPGGGG